MSDILNAIVKCVVEENMDYRDVIKDLSFNPILKFALIHRLAVYHGYELMSFDVEHLEQMPAPMFGEAFPLTSMSDSFIKSSDHAGPHRDLVYKVYGK